LREVLGKTLGVPLFQEQAMKLAIVAAGFSPAEADGLRRAMATFRRNGTIHNYEEKLVEGMVRRGYERDFAERCFEQIKGFGDYGFPESHAQAFASLAYVSAWLKCHYPAVFACALLNSQPMGFYAPAQIVRDAREHGVTVHPIDVGASVGQYAGRRAGAAAGPAPDRRFPAGLGRSHRPRARRRAVRLDRDAGPPRRSAAPRAASAGRCRCARFAGPWPARGGWEVRRMPPVQLPLFAAMDAPELGRERDPPCPRCRFRKKWRPITRRTACR
jgi:error-prone DNA polymerase